MANIKAKHKVVARKKAAAQTDKTTGSLIRCEVNLERGEWVQPSACQVFYIDETAKFPDVNYEIKTEESGPYEWSWEIIWIVKACPQKAEKQRFTPKAAKTFRKKGSFSSDSKTWKADLGEVIGGDLTVKVKAGSTTFVRKTFIRGKDPGEARVHAELETYSEKKDAEIVKKIFRQESRTRHFYSDEMPLVSFDNGYGLGQLTNPSPTYEEAWNWKKHVKAVMDSIKSQHRKNAKKYLDQHKNYTDDMLDLETLASYNGLSKKQRYHNWNAEKQQWEVNSDVICDPQQSNKGWLITEKENANQTLEELRGNTKSKPFYTGRCYAEHIKSNQ